jgi:uroporphyrinogen-III decarboxylase
MDLYLDPENAGKAMDVIIESALLFISLQIEAGAHCIGIGDAFCSQIGPGLYEQFAFMRQKKLVDHIHSLGAIAKLHICGDTESILPLMIATGADIVDIDHLVPSMAGFVPLLGPKQVFSGKADPVSVIQDGTAASIEAVVQKDVKEAAGRCIISAGCEITPGTSSENMHSFRLSAKNLMEYSRL